MKAFAFSLLLAMATAQDIAERKSSRPKPDNTVYVTSQVTITDCGPAVTNCPYLTHPITTRTITTYVKTASPYGKPTHTPYSLPCHGPHCPYPHHPSTPCDEPTSTTTPCDEPSSTSAPCDEPSPTPTPYADPIPTSTPYDEPIDIPASPPPTEFPQAGSAVVVGVGSWTLLIAILVILY